MGNHRELEVWKRGVGFAMGIYKVTDRRPRHELYGLVTDMRRAAISIPKNVSEGYGRNNTGEYVQFVGISIGSSCELDAQLEMVTRESTSTKRLYGNSRTSEVNCSPCSAD